MDNNFYKFHPDLRIIKSVITSHAIKTEDGWGTIETESKVITGWGIVQREVGYGAN